MCHEDARPAFLFQDAIDILQQRLLSMGIERRCLIALAEY